MTFKDAIDHIIAHLPDPEPVIIFYDDPSDFQPGSFYRGSELEVSEWLRSLEEPEETP